jgi:hypothetical protein
MLLIKQPQQSVEVGVAEAHNRHARAAVAIESELVSGLDEDGIAEHIADRNSYADTLSFVVKLVPGILFPSAPTLIDSFPPA